jgi:hypothetical protein
MDTILSERKMSYPKNDPTNNNFDPHSDWDCPYCEGYIEWPSIECGCGYNIKDLVIQLGRNLIAEYTDTQLLDWLETKACTTKKWICKKTIKSSKWMLCESDHKNSKASIRDAIKDAIKDG